MPAANQRPENELRAEAYLSRVSALQSELTCQLQHLRALRAHGRAASGAQDVLTPLRLRQVQRRVEQLRADLSRAQREVAWAVGRLPNPRARTLMEMRYLSCLTWDEKLPRRSMPRPARRCACISARCGRWISCWPSARIAAEGLGALFCHNRPARRLDGGAEIIVR